MTRIGLELEVSVVKNGKLVDVFSVVGETGKRVKHAYAKTDAGWFQLEISLDPVGIEDLHEVPLLLENALWEVKNWLGDVDFVFTGMLEGMVNVDIRGIIEGKVSPPLDILYSLWCPKVRYQQLISYFQERFPHWHPILLAPLFNALHVHIQTKDPFNARVLWEGNFLLPSLAVQKGWASPHRLKWWQCGWCEKERVVPCVNGSFISQWERVPPIFDLPKPGTVWWLCRPRPDYGTWEFRFFDSCEPSEVVERIEWLLEFVT